MYVVRIEFDEDRTDFKGFVSRTDAEKRFADASALVRDEQLESVVWFEVPDVSDVRKAVDAVKNGANGVVVLGKVPVKIKLDLSSLMKIRHA